MTGAGDPSTLELRDDSTILDSDIIWRRVAPHQIVQLDQNLGRSRASTGAFDDSSDGTPMSACLARIVLQRGESAEVALQPFPGFCMVWFTAGFVRSLGLGVMMSPPPDEHVFVFGKKTKSVTNKLAKQSDWIVAPPKS
ncbi:MAG: hypothetical protein IT381_19025 [Deltaproteobacteria bacterium]|nr:hypothetical protein [Deltaproteobacteria bacterium]